MSNTINYPKQNKLLSPGMTNAKTAKNIVKTFILYMAPAETVAGFNLCPFSSPGCRKSCLYSAGRGKFSNVQAARIKKSEFWIFDRESFYLKLLGELNNIANNLSAGEKIAIRLNGTTDIDHIELMKRYLGIDLLGAGYESFLFYDYTKNPNVAKKYIGSSYKITFSRSETNEAAALEVLAAGGNVAAVFVEVPAKWKGYEVINGDATDLRYFDPMGIVVGLYAKGEAKKDTTGFVISKN